MAIIFKLPSKDGNITPEKASKSRQMQLRDRTGYVRGLCYRWDPSLSRKPLPRFPHFMPPCHSGLLGSKMIQNDQYDIILIIWGHFGPIWTLHDDDTSQKLNLNLNEDCDHASPLPHWVISCEREWWRRQQQRRARAAKQASWFIHRWWWCWWSWSWSAGLVFMINIMIRWWYWWSW